MKNKLEVGDNLYFISDTSIIHQLTIAEIKDGVATTGNGLRVSVDADLKNGEPVIIKNIFGFEIYAPFPALEQAYNEQQIKAQFQTVMNRLKKRELTINQMQRIILILSE